MTDTDNKDPQITPEIVQECLKGIKSRSIMQTMQATTETIRFENGYINILDLAQAYLQLSAELKQLRAERVGTEQKEDDEYNHPPLFGYRYSLVPDESIAEIRIGFSTVTHRDESLRAIKEMFKSKLTDSAQSGEGKQCD